MNSHPARASGFRGFVAIATIVLASIVGHGAVAQAQVSTGSGSPAAVLSASAQDIREIRGPKPIASPWLIPLIALSVFLSGAGVWAAWVWYRRRPRLFLQTPVEIALARLEYARELMQPELGRDFSIEVSSIVREYMERRFRVMAAHLTTHEFLHDSLSSADPLLAANRPLLAEFMESCDLAKFGGWNLSIQDMGTMLQSARRFVVESAAESARPDTAAGPTTISTNLAPTAAINSLAVIPRETYGSLPST
jgi:hypothetical protein